MAAADSPAPTLAKSGPICSHSGETARVPVSAALNSVVTHSSTGLPSSSTHSASIVTPRRSPGFEPGMKPPASV